MLRIVILASNYLEDVKKTESFKNRRELKSLILGLEKEKILEDPKQEAEEYLAYK